ncbi:hypothetical protein ACLF6K_13650 [Streptomyces xanthophaeus]
MIIGDDGAGAAHPARGGGLSGLTGRLAGIDGTLTASSGSCRPRARPSP